MSADTTGTEPPRARGRPRLPGCDVSPSTAPTNATPSATPCGSSSTTRCTRPTAIPTSASPSIRGAGPCFSSGYDLKSSLSEGQPFYTPPGDGSWSRHVADGWSRIWDLAKPVIAQVHGYAMAGGTELMAACDLVYIAEDAQLSYPVVRVVSPPDFQFHVWLVGMRAAMELMLTGDAIDGREAVRIGMANRAFPEADLERETLAMAARVGVDPERPPADQQAHGAPGDGVQGRAHGDARGLRAAGAGQQPRDVEAVLRRRPVGRGQASSPAGLERDAQVLPERDRAVVLVLLAPRLDAVDVPAHEVVPADQVLVAEVHELADASRPRRGTRDRARRCPRRARVSPCRRRGRARGSRAGPWRRVRPRRRAGGSP